MLLDLLFILSRENEQISYRQGLHEIAALILWVVNQDKVVQPPSGAASEPYVRHGVAKRARARVSDACPAAAMKGRRARAH